MSIATEISRISGNVSDALTAIADKGVTVPSGSNSDDLADLIDQIETGGGGSISISDEPNATGTTLVVTGDSSGGGGVIVQDENGYLVLSTQGGGGSPSATQHSIYFEFSDGTDTTIPVYYDDALLSTMITAYTPSTYGVKTVTLAQLDGVTWYEPMNIPIGVELIDYTKVVNGYVVEASDGTEHVSQWACCSDYTVIDPTMTFEFRAYQWYDMAFYDSNKTFISGVTQYQYADSVSNDYATGTLTSARIPSNAVYIRLSSYPNIDPDDQSSTQVMSLIRTA